MKMKDFGERGMIITEDDLNKRNVVSNKRAL